MFFSATCRLSMTAYALYSSVALGRWYALPSLRPASVMVLGALDSGCIAGGRARTQKLHRMFEIAMFELAMAWFIQAEYPKERWVIRG